MPAGRPRPRPPAAAALRARRAAASAAGALTLAPPGRPRGRTRCVQAAGARSRDVRVVSGTQPLHSVRAVLLAIFQSTWHDAQGAASCRPREFWGQVQPQGCRQRRAHPASAS